MSPKRRRSHSRGVLDAAISTQRQPKNTDALLGSPRYNLRSRPLKQPTASPKAPAGPKRKKAAKVPTTSVYKASKPLEKCRSELTQTTFNQSVLDCNIPLKRHIENQHLEQGAKRSPTLPPSYSERGPRFAPYYRHWRFDTSDTGSMTPTNKGQTSAKSEGGNIRATNNTDYTLGLKCRGVKPKRETKDVHDAIDEKIYGKISYKTTKEEEQDWKNDLNKCQKECEALFQHTIMMDVIDRHNLKHILDYTVESLWACPPLPFFNGLTPDDATARPLSQPKPDLMVAFKADEVVPFEDELLLPPEFPSRICPEKPRTDEDGRAFPFFILEVKASKAANPTGTALRQSLHSASLSLYNMWKLFETSEKLRGIFFQKIKVFTAYGSSESFEIRSHWAIPHTITGSSHNTEQHTALTFHCRTIKTLKEPDYTKRNVIGLVKNILNYGVEEMLPELKLAIGDKLPQRVDHAPRATIPDLEQTSVSGSLNKRDRGHLDAGSGPKTKRPATRKKSTRAATQSFNGMMANANIDGSDRSAPEVAG